MRNLLRSRRGSVAFATVIALVPLIGVVALGAEAGSWYVTRQHAQNAADSAAYSGALRLACTIAGASCDTKSVDYRGKEFAAQNGFCNSSPNDATAYPDRNCATSLPTRVSRAVQIDIGDYNGTTFTTPSTGTGNAVRARVSQQQPAYLAAVLGLTTVNIPAQAIALVKLPSKVCALALGPNPTGGGALKLAGDVSNNGTGCPLMSDASVQFASTPSFSGSGWAVYGANGCSPTNTCADPGIAHNYFMPPAMDPLQGLTTASFNTRTSPSTKPCGGNVTNGQTCSLNPNSASGVYSDLKVNSGGTVNFAPGTYLFYNATISFGGTVSGTGVTLVLLGNSSLTINGGNVNLSAPTTNAFSSALNGVLIDDQSTANVNIGGNGVIKLAGAMYFPKADVSFGGSTQPSNTTCSEVIAKTLTMTGGGYLSTDGCAPTVIAYTQVVSLVQ
ncbi:Flp pilus assembly protein TadG/phage baseplate assembly protein gpV [Bradyrhizobium sp. JR4.1]|uniref:pilus assembly protein TadG-related protein n=1 Tax=unclassified Bradyrhizobium TaxID=2631580 RepID=UPI00025D1BF4|nr:pilus assembly protein TadG-related protein [Bradyrhizobium sp. WSM1253]EIG56974.1 Flp pilus assembly protein TadG [Bradyrhizobium sp. WSM1253]